MAKLHIDHLAAQLTKGTLYLAMEKLPEDREETYGNAMNRSSSQNMKQQHLAMITSRWITFTKQPLETGALQHAVSMATDSKEINEEDLIDVDLLVSFCCGFVSNDRESSVIRHVHHTLQIYLEDKLPRVQSNIEIARTCLRCLGCPVFATPCEDTKSLTEWMGRYKLSPYAASHWADHVPEGSQILEQVVLETFENDGNRTPMLQMQYCTSKKWVRCKRTYNYSKVHLASAHGLSNICHTLLCNYQPRNILEKLSKPKRLCLFGIL